jgi:regulator of protease activity HflC (stomatin/prohibitin superfamily)
MLSHLTSPPRDPVPRIPRRPPATFAPRLPSLHPPPVARPLRYRDSMPRVATLVALVAAALACSGCATTTVEPGHRGLLFAPGAGGLRREVLQPGNYKLGWCFVACTRNRIDDFDVTYSTRAEHLPAQSAEGLTLDLSLSVIYRPIISELYQLDTEIGPAYYDEVIGPEFRSACRGVLARRSYLDMRHHSEAIEDEIESELRSRTRGKHVEIASVTLEQVTLPPEIAEAVRKKIATEAESQRQVAVMNAEYERRKLQIEHDSALRRLEQAPSCGSATPAAPPSDVLSR